MVVFFAGWFDSFNHLFVLFLCRKCYGMVDKREFCFVLLCAGNVNCSIKRSISPPSTVVGHPVISIPISFLALSVCYVLVLISDEVRVLTALPL